MNYWSGEKIFTKLKSGPWENIRKYEVEILYRINPPSGEGKPWKLAFKILTELDLITDY